MTMNFTWKKPVVVAFEVNGECTAYAGALRLDVASSRSEPIVSRASNDLSKSEASGPRASAGLTVE